MGTVDYRLEWGDGAHVMTGRLPLGSHGEVISAPFDTSLLGGTYRLAAWIAHWDDDDDALQVGGDAAICVAFDSPFGSGI